MAVRLRIFSQHHSDGREIESASRASVGIPHHVWRLGGKIDSVFSSPTTIRRVGVWGWVPRLYARYRPPFPMVFEMPKKSIYVYDSLARRMADILPRVEFLLCSALEQHMMCQCRWLLRFRASNVGSFNRQSTNFCFCIRLDSSSSIITISALSLCLSLGRRIGLTSEEVMLMTN